MVNMAEETPFFPIRHSYGKTKNQIVEQGNLLATNVINKIKQVVVIEYDR